MSIKLIVGLGNYPKQYDNTRHNAGSMVIDELLNHLNLKLDSQNFQGLYTKTEISQNTIILAKPLTLMNLSGNFISSIVNFYKINVEDILIICDDLDTKIGQFRIRKSGSSGGQNGLKDIINKLGTENFKRIRMGIGRPQNLNIVDYVLSEFSQEEKLKFEEAKNKVINPILAFIHGENFENIMSKYNCVKNN